MAKPGRPAPKDQLRHYNLSLDEKTAEKARLIGLGSISAAIRFLVARANKNMIGDKIPLDKW